MPRQVSTGIPRTGSGVPIAAEKKTSIFIGSVVGLQERLDPLPQVGIAQAFAIQRALTMQSPLTPSGSSGCGKPSGPDKANGQPRRYGPMTYASSANG